MKLFLLGATGQTGSILLQEALLRGHSVTAYVRNPGRITLQHENLCIIQGDLLNSENMATAMRCHDVVISCLGGNDNDSTTVITELTQSVVNGMKLSHVNRIISISSAGIHDEFSFVTNIILKIFYKNVITDHKLAAQSIMNSGLQYTLARPLSLTNGEKKETYRKAVKGVPKGGKNISRKDLAHFLLMVMENDCFKNQTVGLAY